MDNTGPRLAEANPSQPDVLADFRLFAVVKTWMDEDIIAAVVRNAFTQGVESVFVVDNGSTDATVERAEEAGAIIAEVFDTPAFDGPLAQVLMNAVVARSPFAQVPITSGGSISTATSSPKGLTAHRSIEYLATLDRRFRVVGSACFNHLPNEKPEYLAGFHPIDFQPLYFEFLPAWTPMCGQRSHWKHPLQRFDRGGNFIVSRPGSHGGICPQDLVEPEGGIITHHFQYRDEDLTRAKLQLTCGPGSRRTALYGTNRMDGFSRRLRSLDAVYAQRWDDVEVEINRTLAALDPPRPWPAMDSVRRWYSLSDLHAARLARANG